MDKGVSSRAAFQVSGLKFAVYNQAVSPVWFGTELTKEDLRCARPFLMECVEYLGTLAK